MIENETKDSNLILSVIGKNLSAVIFVQDYIQLQFDGSIMTILRFPSVKIEAKCYEFGNIEYRNKICEQINKEVRSIAEDENNLDLLFEDNSIISVSLDYENLQIPEILVFQNENGEIQVW